MKNRNTYGKHERPAGQQHRRSTTGGKISKRPNHRPTTGVTGSTHSGTVRVSKYGTGFFDLAKDDTVRIESADLNTALPGDTVEMTLHPAIRGKEKTGYVTKILKRARILFVGTIKHDQATRMYYLKPDDRRVYMDIAIIGTQKLTEGHKALVELTEWSNPRQNPEGRLMQVLGPAGAHETEMAAASLSRGFSPHFPVEVDREAREHERKFVETVQKELAHRRDFRNIPTCTIDPSDAKDFDDALSVQELDNDLIEVGVHIADVSFFVTPGSALDHEATKRATSVYLVDRTIPMLPESLSNNICSLIPNEERLAYSAIMTMTKDGDVRDTWIGRTVIKSHKRFSYEDAQIVLDTGKGPLAEKLLLLNKIAKKLRGERIDKGSVIFDKPEVKIVLDENKKPIGVKVKHLQDSNRLIEEFMLLANRLVAEYIGKQKKFKGFVYRIHDLPDREKIEMLGIFLRGLGYDFGGKKQRVTARDINALFANIHGSDEESLIQTATLRSMAKAIYSTRNIGHFGLGFEYYTHFTSPIRRYPDVLVHRLLEKHKKGTPLAGSELAILESQAKHSSEREVEAAEAERDSVRFKQLEYMSTKVGQALDGVISGITEWGMFVEDKETKSEGLIRLANLSDDYYMFDQKTYSLVGSRTKKKFRLGDSIRVRITRVDTELREMDFEIVK